MLYAIALGLGPPSTALVPAGAPMSGRRPLCAKEMASTNLSGVRSSKAWRN